MTAMLSCVNNISESALLMLISACLEILSMKLRELLCVVSSQAGVRSILIGNVQREVCLRRFLCYLVLLLVTGLQTQEVESERCPFSKGHV